MIGLVGPYSEHQSTEKKQDMDIRGSNEHETCSLLSEHSLLHNHCILQFLDYKEMGLNLESYSEVMDFWNLFCFSHSFSLSCSFFLPCYRHCWSQLNKGLERVKELAAHWVFLNSNLLADKGLSIGRFELVWSGCVLAQQRFWGTV